MSGREPSEVALEDKEPKIKKLIRFLALIPLSPLIYSLAYEAGVFLTSDVSLSPLSWFLGGFLLYVVLSQVISREMLEVYEHFEHELAHAVVAFLCLKDIRAFLVNPDPESSKIEETSAVRYRGRSNFVSVQGVPPD